MSKPIGSTSGESAHDVLDAWNLEDPENSDCGFDDSLLGPSPPAREIPPRPLPSPRMDPPPPVPPPDPRSGGLSEFPAASKAKERSLFSPLHFTMRQGTPPSGLDPADSLIGQFHRQAGPDPARTPSIPRETTGAPAGVSQPKLGDVIAGYTLRTELGRGAFARVFLAEQIELSDRLVALKVSRPEGEEPQMLARLQHTHIVPIHSMHDDPVTGLRLLCMPYLGGANLAQVLEASGTHSAGGHRKLSLVHALDEVSQRLQSIAGQSIRSFRSVPSRDVSGLSAVKAGGSSTGVEKEKTSLRRDPNSPASVLSQSLSRPSFDRFHSLWSRITRGKPARHGVGKVASLDHRDFDQPARQFLREADTIQAAVWITARLAEGLEHAHSRGLLHRDLKPSNILIAADGTPMLLDFNLSTLSRASDAEEGEKAMLGGTLPYMSPEHIDAFNPEGTTPPEAVDERSDVYSLGLILFEAIAGSHPFHEPPPGTPLLLVIKHLADQRRVAPSVRTVVPAAPWSLDSILRKCLDPNPALRYSRARDLSEDLNRFLDDQPLKHAPEPSVRERVEKWMRRNPRLCGNTSIAALAALVIFALGGLIGLFSTNSQNLSSRLKLKVFQEEVDQSRFLLNVASGPTEHRAQGTKLAQRTLDGLTITHDGDLGSRSWVRRLTQSEQIAVRQDASELMLLIARAVVADAERSKVEARKGEALKHAIAWLDTAEHLDPAPPPALFAERARYHSALGESGLAAKDRNCEAATGPVTGRDFALLGTIRLARGNLSGAETALVRAVELEPRRFWAWYALGHTRFEQGRFVDAAADFLYCSYLEPKFAWPRLNRGLCLVRVGRLGEARTCYEQAVAANSRFAEAWINLALADLELNDIPAAEGAMTKAVGLGRNGSSEYLVLAEIKARRGDRDGAEALFSRVFAERGESASLLAARGIFRIEFDHERSLADLRRATTLDPTEARAHYGLALALRGDSPREALKEADEALSADPSMLDALQVRSLLRARAGDLAALEDAERLCQVPTPHRLYNAACTLAILIKTAGENRLASRAIELLGRSLDAGIAIEIASQDPDFESLQRFPAFAELIAKHQDRTRARP